LPTRRADLPPQAIAEFIVATGGVNGYRRSIHRQSAVRLTGLRHIAMHDLHGEQNGTNHD
jgi:hypothetical protein